MIEVSSLEGADREGFSYLSEGGSRSIFHLIIDKDQKAGNSQNSVCNFKETFRYHEQTVKYAMWSQCGVVAC
jgi:hypothetical protein